MSSSLPFEGVYFPLAEKQMKKPENEKNWKSWQ